MLIANSKFQAKHMDIETLKKEIEKHGPEYLNNFIESSKPGGPSANDKTSNDDDS